MRKYFITTIKPCREKENEIDYLETGGVRYGSQTPIFKARSSRDQNYYGRKEC